VCEDQDTVYTDVTQLFEMYVLIIILYIHYLVSLPHPLRLWNSLETSPSNTGSVCVDLLLECAKYLAEAAPPVSKRRPDRGGIQYTALSLYMFVDPSLS